MQRAGSWRCSRCTYDEDERPYYHELVVGRVTYLPDIPPFAEVGLEREQEREMLRAEQQLFLQTMAVALKGLEGDYPAAIDLRVGKAAGLGSIPRLAVAVVGRVTETDAEEAARNADQLWHRLATAFPAGYGFTESDDDAFRDTVLPTEDDLLDAHYLCELTKHTYTIRGHSGRVVGTFGEALDAMRLCWDTIARFPERVLLSVRLQSIPDSEVDKIRNEAERSSKLVVTKTGTGTLLDTPMLEDAARHLDNLLSAAQLLRFRIQLVCWQGDPLAIRAALQASLSISPDTRERHTECRWQLHDLLTQQGRDAVEELTHVRILPGNHVWGDHGVTTPIEANAVWRLPLARRYGIAGIAFRRDPLFTQEPLPQEPPVLTLGTLLSKTSQHSRQELAINRLTRHMLVVGEPGAGKSTTTQSTVLQLWKAGIPSLVIDPVSTEYSELWAISALFRAEHPTRPDMSLCVFTPGAAGNIGGALSFNPFCPQPGVSLNEHIVTLRSCFASAFGLPDAWKELIGRALRAAYHDFGWPTHDVERNRQPISMNELATRAFPTIIDFIKAVERETIKYGRGEFRSNTEAGLLGRLRDLSVGPLGAMIQTRRRLDAAALTSRPVVLQLHKISEADAKSLVILFLLTQLRQYYDTQGRSRHLRHLIIVEEAHRLLSPSPMQPDMGSNSRAESITLFVNMLAELRKVGIGLMLVEQLPSRLEQNVIKLPGTKIMHRLSAPDDRTMMAQAMNMTDEQTKYIATLSTGEAAMFTEGLVEPVLLCIENPWKSAEPPIGQRPRPDTVEEQEQLEQEVAQHTLSVWPMPEKKELPWNPCNWCQCGCQYRTRLLEADKRWWEKIQVRHTVNNFLRTYQQSKQLGQVLSGTEVSQIAGELWELVQECYPKDTQGTQQEYQCGLVLACEQYIFMLAKQEKSRTQITDMEKNIEMLLRYITKS